MSYSIPRDVFQLLEAAFNHDREKAEVLVVSQIFRRLQPALICGQNYPAKAINCL